MKITSGASFPVSQDKKKIEEEYMSLMAELVKGPPPPKDNDKNSMCAVGNINGGLFRKSQPLKPLMSIPQSHSIPNAYPPTWLNQLINGKAPMAPTGINVPFPWKMPPPSNQQYSNILPPLLANQNFLQQMQWVMPPPPLPPIFMPPPPPPMPPLPLPPTSMPPPWQQGLLALSTVSGTWPPPTQPCPGQIQQQAKVPPLMTFLTMMVPPPDLQTLLAVPPPPLPPHPLNVITRRIL